MTPPVFPVSNSIQTLLAFARQQNNAGNIVSFLEKIQGSSRPPTLDELRELISISETHSPDILRQKGALFYDLIEGTTGGSDGVPFSITPLTAREILFSRGKVHPALEFMDFPEGRRFQVSMKKLASLRGEELRVALIEAIDLSLYFTELTFGEVRKKWGSLLEAERRYPLVLLQLESPNVSPSGYGVREINPYWGWMKVDESLDPLSFSSEQLQTEVRSVADRFEAVSERLQRFRERVMRVSFASDLHQNLSLLPPEIAVLFDILRTNQEKVIDWMSRPQKEEVEWRVPFQFLPLHLLASTDYSTDDLVYQIFPFLGQSFADPKAEELRGKVFSLIQSLVQDYSQGLDSVIHKASVDKLNMRLMLFIFLKEVLNKNFEALKNFYFYIQQLPSTVFSFDSEMTRFVLSLKKSIEKVAEERGDEKELLHLKESVSNSGILLLEINQFFEKMIQDLISIQMNRSGTYRVKIFPVLSGQLRTLSTMLSEYVRRRKHLLNSVSENNLPESIGEFFRDEKNKLFFQELLNTMNETEKLVGKGLLSSDFIQLKILLSQRSSQVGFRRD